MFSADLRDDRRAGRLARLVGQRQIERLTQQYEQALRDHGFSDIVGSDASVQPGKLQELMLHEIAVAWVRVRLAQTVPPNKSIA